ncbi:hypothetical protein BLOT_000014, partial [Blomia tropicalis]
DIFSKDEIVLKDHIALKGRKTSLIHRLELEWKISIMKLTLLNVVPFQLYTSNELRMIQSLNNFSFSSLAGFVTNGGNKHSNKKKFKM